jgi:hypothetical protein
MCVLYEYNIVRSTGKLCFARGTHENFIYQGHPPASSNQLLHRTVISLRSIAAGELVVMPEKSRNKLNDNMQ